jgi:hypothetical protein
VKRAENANDALEIKSSFEFPQLQENEKEFSTVDIYVYLSYTAKFQGVYFVDR